MSYIYAVRGWLELSWPDAEIEGVDETPEQHQAKVEGVRACITSDLPPALLLDEGTPLAKRYKGGWCMPQSDLDGTEYVFFGGDVEDPSIVLNQVREVLRIDPFADGYFSIEGEDGEQYRQWLVVSGKIYARRQLFPDFDIDEAPEGYSELPPAKSS